MGKPLQPRAVGPASGSVAWEQEHGWQGQGGRDSAAGTVLQGQCSRDSVAGTVLQGQCCRDSAAGTVLQEKRALW